MNIIPPAPLSDLLPVHLFVQLFRSEPVRGTEQVSCQTRLPWVKMAGEVLLYPPPPPHLLSLLYPTLWFNTEKWPPTLVSFTSFVIIFCPNIGRRGSSEVSPLEGWEVVGSCYYPGAGWPRRGHRPLPRFQWHFHSLSLCNNISHTALSFTINLCWSYFQSKGTHKA